MPETVGMVSGCHQYCTVVLMQALIDVLMRHSYRSTAHEKAEKGRNLPPPVDLLLLTNRVVSLNPPVLRVQTMAQTSLSQTERWYETHSLKMCKPIEDVGDAGPM
jgi:hypothetical protein